MNDCLKSFEIVLLTTVLAYQLLKNANLPEDKRDLAHATVSFLTFHDIEILMVKETGSGIEM